MYLTDGVVILRDFKEKDVEDVIRWETEEIEWKRWDAPWENDFEGPFIESDYRYIAQKRLKRIEKLKDTDLRDGFEICIKDEKERHIGWSNIYNINKNFEYTRFRGFKTIGIDIPDKKYRNKGYGKRAWILLIRYLLANNITDIFTQTWNGNFIVIKLMDSIGFKEHNRKENKYYVYGEYVDEITYKLDIDFFKKIFI